MFCTFEEAIKVVRAGKMLIIVDDEGRENEGDLVIAGEFATPEAVNFMATHGRGLICVAVDSVVAERFQLHPMVSSNNSRFTTNFTQSIEAKEGVTTGISAYDRSITIQLLANPHAKASDIVAPGHIFPLIAKKGGVLERQGQTEASVDLMRYAKLQPVGVICEIMNTDGTMARMPDLEVFSQKHGIPILTVQEIMRYRIACGDLAIEEIARVPLPTERGSFTLISYAGDIPEQPHLVLLKESHNTQSHKLPLVRLHSECATGDIFGSLRCDCGKQLHYAMDRIEDAGYGAILYLRQEGRGIGLVNKLKAYTLQDKGLDTVEANEQLGFKADAREYFVAAQILKSLGFETISLLSNNPQKKQSLQELGIGVQKMEAVEFVPCTHNQRYMVTKKEKLGHILSKV